MSDLSAQAFAVLDRRLCAASEAPLAVALSGGGDSMALLQLAADWAATRGRRLLALTVDHGLNPDSAAWTAAAGRAARAVRADWRPLGWNGPKPETGLPAAAREARHALMAEAARAAGASVILMGHTLDDAQESGAMRAGEVPCLPLLREWGPSPAWPQGRGVFLLRPLLGLCRDALRDFLRGRAVSWIDDPANLDPRYARVRARQANPAGDLAPAVETEPLVRAEAAADGRILLRADHAGPRAVAAALLSASGSRTPPRGEALSRLVERIAAGADFQATLAGCRVAMTGGVATFVRELGRRPPAALPLCAGETAVWDGRFEVRAERAELCVAALAGRASRLARADQSALARLPALARPALPVLVDADGGAALPYPWGRGAGEARPLAGSRFAAACGEFAHEAAIRN